MNTSFNKLNRVFENTTNSYKYYWWLAILKLVKKDGERVIHMDDIAIEMLLLVWYPINYYKISLGKQDQLSKYIKTIKEEFKLPDQVDENELRAILQGNDSNRLKKDIIGKILKYVPYRFVRPWYPEISGLKDHQVNSQIVTLQESTSYAPPSFLHDPDISWESLVLNVTN